jgi:hypothetical protein
MALRVARGLFRLWLVLSVLWIGGVGYVTWQTFPQDKYVLPSDRPAAPSTGMFEDLIPKRPETLSAKPRSDEFDPKDFAAWKLAQERRSAIWHAGLLAFLPPALAFGSALVWAFRGFR